MVIIIITASLMIARFIFSFIPLESIPPGIIRSFIDGKDRDIHFYYLWMERGLFEMYLPPESAPYFIGHLYLYHWYFIFLPFYLMPKEVTYILWDILRITSTIYITYRFYEITRNKRECALFLIFCGIGYAVDMHYNNANWLILFLLVLSYIQLEKDRKWLSGILFTIATFKIYVILFPFLLLITKKIKIKEIIYYLLPFAILCIPYMINPPYFLQMVSNWNQPIGNDVNIILSFVNVVMKLFEPAQLMFVSFMVLILVLNVNQNIIKDKLWKFRIFVIAISGETLMFITYLIFLSIITVP